MSETIITKFITAANQYDTETFLGLFSADAMIDDVSVGEKFKQHTGIKKYFTSYFIGYHTKTQLLSIEQLTPNHMLAKIDFTGDFGHETGGLDIRLNETGLIAHIAAYLD